jgi:hypothetical protein
VKSTLRYATFVVLAHAGVAYWHLFLCLKICPALQQVLLNVAVLNFAPLVALVLLWQHSPRLGGLLLGLALAAGLYAGSVEHFLDPGPFNVFHLAATKWALPFQVTVILLPVLQVLGCWVAIQSFRGVPLLKAKAEQ